MTVTAKISRYDSRCVSPVTASSVMTAPLCGSVSMPPLAIATTRCSTSSGMPAACAPLMKVSDMAASAMLMPPDAEPVMPASELTDTAALTSGLGTLLSASLTSTKPGSAAMTPPKPYSDAVFIAASSAPPTATLVPSAKRARTRPNAVAMISTMPDSSAPSRPDADQRLDGERDRCVQARQRVAGQRVAVAVPAGDQLGQREVDHAHQHQRRHRQQRVRQRVQ